MEYKARCHCGRVRFSFRGPEIDPLALEVTVVDGKSLPVI